MNEPTKISRYEIKEELGRGGMATVYLAHDPYFNRQVAIKVLPLQFTHDPMFLGRFKREAQTIAALEHQAIVPVHDFGETDDGQPFLVMRYMSGGSLVERIANGPLSEAAAAAIVQRIGSALDEAHRNGIVHRDLKPGNILFDHHGNAYLSDFGIVKLAESTTTFTGNNIIGTPAYMSPEQARGNANLDGRSDVYALGAILFEMLSGQQPYEADTPMGAAVKHITDPVPRITEVKADVPAAFEAIIMQAMAKKPEDRFATASEMAAAVNAAVQGGPLPAYGTIYGADTEIVSGDSAADGDLSPSEPIFPPKLEPKPRRWAWLGIPAVVLVGLLLWGSRSFGFLAAETATATAPPTTTQVAVVTLAATETIQNPVEPSHTPTPTQAASATATATDSPTQSHTPTLTATSTATGTPTPPATDTPLPIVPPQLISPTHGIYQSPITFAWQGTAGVSYQVTLRHVDSDTVHTSDWVNGSSWTFDLPSEQFGNWEWYVTSGGGQRSQSRTFIFDPFPNSGGSSIFSIYDLNRDCYINEIDIDIIASKQNSNSTDDLEKYDFHPDGIIDNADIQLVANQYSEDPYCTLP